MTTSEERLSRLEGVYEHLSTKADMESVRGGLVAVRADVEAVKVDVQSVKEDVQSVRAEVAAVKVDVQSVRAEVASVRVEIEAVKVALAQQETRLIKWMIGTVVTGIAATAAVVLAVVGLFEL